MFSDRENVVVNLFSDMLGLLTVICRQFHLTFINDNKLNIGELLLCLKIESNSVLMIDMRRLESLTSPMDPLLSFTATKG